MNIRQRTEKKFEAFGGLTYDHKYKVFIFMLLFIGLLASRMSTLTVDMSTESFLHEKDPARVVYDKFKDQFGRDERVVVALKTDDVFDPVFLQKLKDVHDDLFDNVPYLKDMTSLINARNTYGEGDQLNVDDLLKEIPQTPEALAKIKSIALANPFYKNLLISADAKYATLILEPYAFIPEEDNNDLLAGFEETAPTEATTQPLMAKEDHEIVEKVKEIVKKHEDGSFEVFIAGSLITNDAIKMMMMHDMQKFMKLAILTVAVLLFLLFRRIVGVLLPLITVILSVVGTLGIMAILHIPVQITTQIMPSFLISVGVGASVHVLAIFFKHFNQHADKRAAIIYTLGHSGLAILMTSLTTAAGLVSFFVSDVAPISNLGIMTALGVMIAFVLTIVLLNTLLAIVPIKPNTHGGHDAQGPAMDRILERIANFSTTHAKPIVTASFIIIVAALAIATQVKFSHFPTDWLPESLDARRSTTVLDEAMRGTMSMEVVLDTGEENGLYDPDVLQAIDALSGEIEQISGDGYFVGKVFSVSDILKETNKALHANDKRHYAIPDNRKLVAQELFLFENSGSDDLENVVDPQFSKARLTIKVPAIDAVKYGPMIDEIVKKIQTRLGDKASITVTGMMPLLAKTLSAGIYGAAHSYLIAFGVITLMMILLLGNVRMGLVSMIPNITPILLVLGIVILADIPLGMFKLLVGAIAIGLAVDDTIHFFYNFRRYYEQTGSVDEAVRLTLTSTGRAMLVTSVVLSVGFLIFMFASMQNVVQFGLLTGLSILFALVADFLLAPALMKLLVHKQSDIN